jgi:hypothetical protein
LFSRHRRGGDCGSYGGSGSYGGHGSNGGYGSNGGNGSHGGYYSAQSEPYTSGYHGDVDPGQPPAAPEMRSDESAAVPAVAARPSVESTTPSTDRGI